MIQFTAASLGIKQTFVSPEELRNTESTQSIQKNRFFREAKCLCIYSGKEAGLAFQVVFQKADIH